jgi:hypothetical protein
MPAETAGRESAPRHLPILQALLEAVHCRGHEDAPEAEGWDRNCQ